MGESGQGDRDKTRRVPRRKFGTLGAQEQSVQSFEEQAIPESPEEHGQIDPDFWKEQQPPHY